MKTLKLIILTMLITMAAKTTQGETFRSLALQALLKAADTALAYQLPSGRFCATAEDQKKTPEDYIYFYTNTFEGYVIGQHLVYTLAVLYTFKDSANPYYKSPKVLDAILKGGQFSETGIEKYAFQEHRFLLSHGEAYRLMEPFFPDAEKTRWKTFFLRIGKDVAQRVARGEKHTGNYTTKEIGVNPNHWAYYNLALLRLGKLLGNEAWVKTGTTQLKNYMKVQIPDGYWNEWNGPAVSYNYVSIHSAAAYYDITHDSEALKALARATQFHMHLTYPDGGRVEALDGRTNALNSKTVCGLFGFSHTAEGRAYATQLLKAVLKDMEKKKSVFAGEAAYQLAEDFAKWEEGPTAPTALDKGDFKYRLTLPGGTRRQGPWYSSFSSISHEYWAENQFFLDRQVRLSVWHDSVGLIIAGPNTRGMYRAGTFSMARNLDQVVGVLLDGSLDQKDDRDVVVGKYDGYTSTLTLRPLDAKRFEITAQVTDQDQKNPKTLMPGLFEAHLFLNVNEGDTLETSAGEKLVLGSKHTEYAPSKIGTWIKKGRWKVAFPGNTRLIWPFTPFNTHSMFGEPNSVRVAMVELTFPSPADTLKCDVMVE